MPPDRIGDARRMFEASWHPHSYFESLGSVGVLYTATNALMMIGFFASVVLILRRASPVVLSLSVVAPLVMGSAAMLIHVLHLTNNLGADYRSFLSTGHSTQVNALKELRSIPFPFYIGATLSACCTVLLQLRQTKTHRQT
jgi:hypothetical protein